ncbi:hypothetical protein M527_01145 [Sphingobium indicum IP26]|nr:hypothetical protein M527_01145 [Sphingobium indicum IP26]
MLIFSTTGRMSYVIQALISRRDITLIYIQIFAIAQLIRFCIMSFGVGERNDRSDPACLIAADMMKLM